METRRFGRLSFRGLKATLCKTRQHRQQANGAVDTTTTTELAGDEVGAEQQQQQRSNNRTATMLKYKKSSGTGSSSSSSKEGLWNTLRRKLGRGRRRCRDSCDNIGDESAESAAGVSTTAKVVSPFRLTTRPRSQEDDDEEEKHQHDTETSTGGYAIQGAHPTTSSNSAGSEQDHPGTVPGSPGGGGVEDVASVQSNNSGSTHTVPQPYLCPLDRELARRVPEGLYLYETPKIRSLTKELYKLSKHGWYWGPITRTEAEEKLADQPDGAFLVRDSSDDRHLLSLSFRSYGKTLHTRIEHCNGLFSFYAQPEPEGHTSIVELIDHSMNYSQSGVFCYSRARSPGSPSFPVRLTKPVSRFTQVRSLQYLCRFIIRQYTRFDHIQKLPLPSRIKGYIEEGHY